MHAVCRRLKELHKLILLILHLQNIHIELEIIFKNLILIYLSR